MGDRLGRADIIGQTIDGVLAWSWTEAVGLDFVECGIALSNGVIFRLPCFADEVLERIEVPAGAVRAEDAVLQEFVYGAVVERLLRPTHDDNFVPGSIRLGLSTGKWLFHEPCAPEGTGAAGLGLLDRLDVEELVDYFR